MMVSSGLQVLVGLLILCDMDDRWWYNAFFVVSTANTFLMLWPLNNSSNLRARAEGTAYEMLVDFIIAPIQAVQVLCFLGRLLCVVFGGCALKEGLPRGHKQQAKRHRARPRAVFVDAAEAGHEVAWPGAVVVDDDDDIETAARRAPAAISFDFDFAEKPPPKAQASLQFFDEPAPPEREAPAAAQAAGGVSFTPQQLNGGISFDQFAATAFRSR